MTIPVDITYYSSPSKYIKTSHSGPITAFENVVRYVCVNHKPDLSCDTCPLKDTILRDSKYAGWDKCTSNAFRVEQKLKWNSYEDQKAASECMTDALQRIDNDPYCELTYVTPKKSLKEKLRSFCIFLNENFLRR